LLLVLRISATISLGIEISKSPLTAVKNGRENSPIETKNLAEDKNENHSYEDP